MYESAALGIAVSHIFLSGFEFVSCTFIQTSYNVVTRHTFYGVNIEEVYDIIVL